MTIVGLTWLMGLCVLARGEDTPSGMIHGTFEQVVNGAVLRYVSSEGKGPINNGNNPPTRNVLVNGDTRVMVEGKASGLGSLKAGMWVRFSAAEAEGVLKSVEAFNWPKDGKEHAFRGNFDALAGGDVVVSLNGRPSTVKMGAGVKVLLDGKAVGVEELRHGMITTVKMKDGVPVAVEAITVERDGATHRCEGDFVSASKEELVLHVWGGDGFDIKFKVGKEMEITRNGKRAALKDFSVGEKVVANYVDGVAEDLSLAATTNGGQAAAGGKQDAAIPPVPASGMP
jgi:hypothetical protein